MCISTSLHPKTANYRCFPSTWELFKTLTIYWYKASSNKFHIYFLLSLPLIKKSVTTDNYRVLIFINYEIDF